MIMFDRYISENVVQIIISAQSLVKFGNLLITIKYFFYSLSTEIFPTVIICQTGKFSRRQYFRQLIWGFHIHKSVVSHLNFSFFRIFRSNQNYTISPTRTINSSSRRIFQHLYRLDICRVQRIKISSDESVNHNQRSRISFK